MTHWADLLRELTAVPGISGNEETIARHLASRLKAFSTSVSIDPLYNVSARFGKGTDYGIAICAHIDTIGMMVKRINMDETLGIVRIGGINYKAIPGTAVRVHTDEGDVQGIVGVRSAHQARPGDEAIRADEEIYIDVGRKAIHVDITSPITYAPHFVELNGGVIASPYLDNRAGCAVLLALAERLKAEPPPFKVHLIGTVQEETNAVGAQSILNTLRPSAAIFIDGTVSYDTPETRGRGETVLGSGAVLTSFLYISGIGSWHAHPVLRRQLKKTAHEHGVPFQQDAVHGLMSDSRVAIPLGIPSAVIGIPMRGKHSAAEMLQTSDLDAVLALLTHALADEKFRITH